MSESERIAKLEEQLMTLGSRINQFNRVMSYVVLLAGRAGIGNMQKHVEDKLKLVTRGRAVLDVWHIEEGGVPEPMLVGEDKG